MVFYVCSWATFHSYLYKNNDSCGEIIFWKNYVAGKNKTSAEVYIICLILQLNKIMFVVSRPYFFCQHDSTDINYVKVNTWILTFYANK